MLILHYSTSEKCRNCSDITNIAAIHNTVQYVSVTYQVHSYNPVCTWNLPNIQLHLILPSTYMVLSQYIAINNTAQYIPGTCTVRNCI